MTPTAIVLGSLTVPGRPDQVSKARTFVAVLAGPELADTATLLTSEVVTNAVLHSASARPDGTVTIVVIDAPEGLLVEVIDDGSPEDVPEVKGDRYAAQGHGLFLVEQLAAAWGYLRDAAGTTVWFRVTAGTEPGPDHAAARDRSGGDGAAPVTGPAGPGLASLNEARRKSGTRRRSAPHTRSAEPSAVAFRPDLRIVYPPARSASPAPPGET